MAKARKAGVNTPFLYNVNLENRQIYMQHVESIKLRDFIFKLDANEIKAGIYKIINYYNI